jgi:hypothetical protein
MTTEVRQTVASAVAVGILPPSFTWATSAQSEAHFALWLTTVTPGTSGDMGAYLDWIITLPEATAQAVTK